MVNLGLPSVEVRVHFGGTRVHISGKDSSLLTSSGTKIRHI